MSGSGASVVLHPKGCSFTSRAFASDFDDRVLFSSPPKRLTESRRLSANSASRLTDEAVSLAPLAVSCITLEISSMDRDTNSPPRACCFAALEIELISSANRFDTESISASASPAWLASVEPSTTSRCQF